MTFLVRNLEGLFVPIGTRNPLFNFTTGFGPSFARDGFIKCIQDNAHEMRVALPYSDMILEEKFNYDEADLREIIYLAYDEDHRWIFLYDITEDLGLLFSDQNPDDIVRDFGIGESDSQFIDVCRKWSASKNEIHAAAIKKWLAIRLAAG